MKALITEVIFLSPAIGKHGIYYTFKIRYNNKEAYFLSKSRNQRDLIEGKECEFTEENKNSSEGNPYIVIARIDKPVNSRQID